MALPEGGVRKPDDPTAEEIRQVCLQIQSGWTEELRRKRDVRCYEVPPIVLVPVELGSP